jgi:hypothetical protein
VLLLLQGCYAVCTAAIAATAASTSAQLRTTWMFGCENLQAMTRTRHTHDQCQDDKIPDPAQRHALSHLNNRAMHNLLMMLLGYKRKP